MSPRAYKKAPRCGARQVIGLVAASLAGTATCSQEPAETYSIDVVTPVGQAQATFAGASTVILEKNGKELSRTMVSGSGGFEVEAGGLKSEAVGATFAVRAVAPDGTVLAFGQTPALEFVVSRPRFVVFVQKPGTFGRSPRDADFPIVNHTAAVGTARANGTGSLAVPVVAFGFGEIRMQGSGGQTVTALVDGVDVWNPFRLGIDSGVKIPGQGAMPFPFRTNASAVGLANGAVLFFGGLARQNGMDPTTRVTDQADLVDVTRSMGALTGVDNPRLARSAAGFMPGVARQGAPLVNAAGTVFAFGGRNETAPLDTIAQIDTTGTTFAGTVLGTRLSAPRDGHTATVVAVGGSTEVLVFGGLDRAAVDAGVPVADLFVPPVMTAPGPMVMKDPGKLTTAMLVGDPGPPRRDHAALTLEKRNGAILLIGGRDLDGKPLATSVLYRPEARTFEPGPITLDKARANAAAFVVGNDLVVAGGLDETGAPIGDAERFDATTLAPLGATPCLARAKATASVLSYENVVLIGGVATKEGAPTNVIEIYQPRR